VDERGQLSLAEIKKKITPKTKVVLVVHLYGLVGEIAEIASWLKKQQIILIEDCAQAIGAKYNHKSSWHIWRVRLFFLFYPTKNLGTLGDVEQL